MSITRGPRNRRSGRNSWLSSSIARDSSVARWRRSILALFGFLFALHLAPGARADECFESRGRACTNDTDCSGAAHACINRTCQVSCGRVPSGMQDEQPVQTMCSLGETCTVGIDGTKQRYFCRPTPFRMDLNLLDSCIYHFVEGVEPALGTGNACSVVRQLTSLLDQNGDSAFDIYDVDQCIKSFLGDPPCNTSTRTCPNQQTYCDSNATCGEGLFCNLQMHRCERECGFITDRDDTEQKLTDRACTGRLQTCDYERGECRDVSLDNATCQLDRDCPIGAYCLVGQCQPRCYRTLDCPDSNWMCSIDNTCLPKPKGPAGGTPFNPKDYSVVYAQDSIALDPFQNEYAVPLLIMNLTTGKQVFSDPKVVFGYRLETRYERKRDARCSGDLTALSQTEQEDCIVSPDEEFLTLGNPFGTLYAEGDPATRLRVNDAGAAKLSPGAYPVNVTAYFNNGQSATVRVVFTKPSPSGEYDGQMSVYLGSPDAHLATAAVSMRLYVRTPQQDPLAPTVTWSDVLTSNNLTLEKEFEDITEGYEVYGYIHAGQSLVFDKPGAVTSAENEIPVKGLYAPRLGRLRLVSVIDLASNYCATSTGSACTADATEFQSKNVFGRNLRRIIEFIGPFRPTERRFEGMYRETISGLTPNTFTVEGGFRLSQITQNSQPLLLPTPLLTPAANKPVQFPNRDALVTAVQGVMSQACGNTSLATAAAVSTYLTNYGTAAPVFPSVVFESEINNALNTIGNTSAGKLTLAESLAGTIKFCGGSVTTSCIDQKKLACGLAFFRRAMLGGTGTASDPKDWFNREALGKDASNRDIMPPLFCNRSATPDLNTCATPGAAAHGAMMFQDHMRFYRELTQTYVYQANAAWSDAFYALYKQAERADALGAAGAFAYKEGKLREAITNYDAVRTEMLGSAATATMFAWPMGRFQGQGDPWLRQMHTVLNDRLDAWTELADLKRRILRNTDLDRTYTFAKHVVNQEYLTQIYLAELQRRWQGLDFQYAGESARVLDRSEGFLAKLSDSRNPLGMHPDRVYFENSDLQVSNWENYRKQVDLGVQTAKTVVQGALTNLHGALANYNDLRSGLLQTEQGRDVSIEQLCGPASVDPPACRVDKTDKELATSCTGPGCPFEWSCDGSDETSRCGNVVKLFSTAVDTVTCRSDIDTTRYEIEVGRDSANVPIKRSCSHGRMGELLQERVKMDLQRKQAKDRVESLLRSIAREESELAATRASNEALIDYLEAQRIKFAAAEAAVAVAEGAYQVASNAANAADCLIIVGFATGTNCAGKAISTGLQIAAVTAKYAVVPALQIAMADMGRAKEITYQEQSGNAELRQLRLRLDSMVADVENIIAEYQMLTQQLYSLDMQIADTIKVAQNTADRFAAQTNDVIRRLVGNDSSQTLRGNELVRAAEAEFQKLLVVAYKMTRAFLHRYNYADTAENWTNRVYKLLTVADVEKLVVDLIEEERRYCGSQGIDCDSINNRQVFRFSVRDELFPQLKNRVDPNTGNVLFAGEQFHNIITSSAYRQKRVLLGDAVEQIEIPFAIWANDLGANGGSPRSLMLSRGECNHLIIGDRSNSIGTIAVNIKGTRIERPGRDLEYQLYRGGTDQVRRCGGSSVVVNTFKVGSPVIDSSSQQAFQTRTAPWAACLNNTDLENVNNPDQPVGCWNFFARDRSLAAPDWIITVPLEGQQWVVGIDDATGVPIPEHEKPIIEDIVLYFRYNARPSN